MLTGRLKVHTRCAAQLVIEADSLFWNERTGKPDQVRSETCGHFDTLDALRYLVMGVTDYVPIAQPLPQPAARTREGMRRW